MYHKDMNKYTSVEEFLADLDASKLEQIELLRTIIKKANPHLTEHIKWNAPSYVLDGEDRITFNIRNKENIVQLILHMGATRAENKSGEPIMADDKHLINWQSDIRGMLSFASIADVKSKQSDVEDIVKRWLAIK